MRNRRSKRGARWLLQGLLVCPHCGYALYGLGSRYTLADGRVVENAHYRCIGRNGPRFGGTPICDNPQVPVRDLDAAVWQDVCELLRNPAKVRDEYKRRQQRSKGAEPSFQGKHLQKQIQNLRKAITRLIDAYQEGVLEKSEFAPRLQNAKERLQRLEQEAVKDAERQLQEQELRLALGGLEDFARQIEEGLDQADWQKRREIIRALVKRIEVGKKEVRIVYRVSPPPFVQSPSGGTFEHCGRLLKTTLVDVPRPGRVVMSMPAHAVRMRQPAHKPRQLSVFLRPQDQVPVIGHQTVGQQPRGLFGHGFQKHPLKGLVIPILLEQRQACDRPVQNVVHQTSRRLACSAWHGWSLSSGLASRQEKRAASRMARELS